MGFWSNRKEKRKKEEQKAKEEALVVQKQKSETVSASVLEETEKQKFNQKIIDSIDNEIKKTEEQKIDDLIEEPHLHSQGFISPKQGIQSFVDDVVDNSNLQIEKKKKNN